MKRIYFLCLISFSFVLSSASAYQAVPGLDAVRIRTDGRLISPQFGGAQYGRVWGNDRTVYLTHLLFSEGTFVNVRTAGGYFTPVRIDPQTGRLQSSFSSGTEIRYLPSLRDLRDYFMANGQSSNPVVRRFLNRYFPNQNASGGSNGNQGNAPNQNHGNPNAGRPVAPPGGVQPNGNPNNNNPAQNPVVPVSPNNPNNPSNPQQIGTNVQNVPLVTRTREMRVWNSQNHSYEIRPRSFRCGSMPVQKRRFAGRCFFAMITAAHCIPVEADFRVGGGNRTPDFNTMTFTLPNGQNFVPQGPQVSFAPGYVGGRGQAPGGDTALVRFHAPCDLFSDAQIARLAPNRGDTRHVGHVWQGSTLRALTHNTVLQGVGVARTNSRGEWLAQLPSDVGVEYGHSGSAVLNSDNELVGVLATGTYPGTFSWFGFNPRGVPWVREQLGMD